LVSFLHSSSNLQQQTKISVFPTNCGGCKAPTARKINKTKGNSENKVFVIFSVKIESKIELK
jgi:hypothetical protein